MRLGNVRLERYGPFERLDLPLDPTPGRVNLIVAPNGYGKSVIRQAIGDFLFKIDARTPMNFRFGTEGMGLTADITHNGTTRTLVRRKGNGNTLADLTGAEIPPADTHTLLGGATETVFQELFGLDTALLRSGGQALLRSQGRLGEVLFAATGGMGRIRDLLTDLQTQRDELGKTQRHKTRPIWSALANWEQANTDLRKHTLRPDGWQTLERAATAATDHLAALLNEQTSENAESESLKTIRACRPWLDRLQTAQATLTDTADAPDLDPGFEKRWRDALENSVKSASAAAAAQAALQAAQDDRTKLTFDPRWIDAGPDIAALAPISGQAAAAERDLPGVARDLQADRTAAAALRQELGWSDAFPLPQAQSVKDAQKRLQQHPKLALDAATAQDRLDQANRDLSATLAELDAMPASGDVATLADLAAMLRAKGDPATQLDAAQRKHRDAEAALRASLAAIPDSRLAEAALTATAAPSDATLDAIGKTLADAENTHARALRDQAERRARIEAERAKLAALERRAALPPPDALAAARAHRDAIWAAFLTPDPPQAVALDRAIRDADQIADALIAHGTEVAEAAAMRANLATLQQQAEADATTVQRTETALTAAQAALLTIARTAGGSAETLPALRTFLRARDAAVTARNARDTAAAERTAAEAHLTTIGTQLAAALDQKMPDPGAITTLLHEADRRIETGRNRAAQRKTLTAQAATQCTAHDNAAAAAAKAARTLADWHAQWAPLIAAIGRPADETTQATAEALARIETLRGSEANAADRQRRVDDMRAAIALLATRTARLADLDPTLAALPPIEAADALHRRLQDEREKCVRCTEADRRIEQATSLHTQATADARTAAAAQKALRAALRAETDEQAEHQLQRARHAAAARADQAEALRHLADQGAGLSVNALTARAAQTTAEADTARLAELDAARQARAPRIEAARTARDAATAARDQAGTIQDAAEAAQRREAAQAALSRTTEEALILHATHALLHTALERQARNASQPLLTRIGQVFKAITGNAQAGVVIEDSREGQTMAALERDGTTRKPLDQLSEGTRDQLYLALRIAALEDYATTTNPLPFIADDILQTFDDPRTKATMQALLDLSERVQVIVLTHHTHIGALATTFPKNAIHVLGPLG